MYQSEAAQMSSPLISTFAIRAAAEIAARELASWNRARAATLVNGVTMIHLGTLATKTHKFLPDSDCPVCGGMPDDSQTSARLRPASHRKLAARKSRVRNLLELEADLDTAYIDGEVGLLDRPNSRPFFSLPMVSTRLRDRHGAYSEIGYGRTSNYATARVVSIAEALERMGGMHPGGKRTVVEGSYNSLQDTAIDPTTLGLYPRERYADEHLPFSQFHGDLKLRWVWGYSFAKRRPMLVPESYAYYGINKHRNDYTDAANRPFVYEISNGCALGSCLEEAIVHGLLEVAERDAFLMTWYAQLAVPEVDVRSVRNQRIGWILERIRSRTGYGIRVFVTTNDIRVPCFWITAEDSMPDTLRP